MRPRAARKKENPTARADAVEHTEEAVPAATEAVAWWPTAALWDAGGLLGHRLRQPPRPLSPVAAGMRLAGPVRTVRHTEGVVSIFEGLDRVHPGEVLLIDNAGRTDEACVGDLVAIEAQLAGVAGLVVWGCHRDTAELAAIGLPVFSLGPCPVSPVRHPASEQAWTTGRFEADSGDIAIGDDDGLVIVPGEAYKKVADVARTVAHTERRQADLARAGVSLREQLRWQAFQERRRTDPSHTFRAHLAEIDGALE